MRNESEDRTLSDDVVYKAAFNRDRIIYVIEEDHALCEALKVVFRLEGFQTATFHSPMDFLDAMTEREPDVVVMASMLEGNQTLALVDAIRKTSGGISIFMIEERPDVPVAVKAMRLGASDVFVKPVDAELLVRAIREVLRRNIHVLPLANGERRVEVRGFRQLTTREREVLQLLISGQSNKETGIKLSISPRTVEVHRSRIMEKLGARNTADLVRIVMTS